MWLNQLPSLLMLRDRLRNRTQVTRPRIADKVTKMRFVEVPERVKPVAVVKMVKDHVVDDGL